MGTRGLAHGATAARWTLTGRPRRRRSVPAAVLALAAVLFAAGALVGPRPGTGPQPPAATAASRAPGFAPPPAGGRALESRIAALQRRLAAVPADDASWASLGLAYVEQARVTADPTFYPRAEGVLQRSLTLNAADNDAASAGMAALASARHDFGTARAWAQRGLAANPFNATLYGTLADAEIQLGNYPEAFEAVQRMVDLRPDTASLARASYTWELRGDLDQARDLMQRALDGAGTASDRAFARHHLGDLAFNAGDPATALTHYEAGLRADPSYARLLEGLAKAEAALGRREQAVAHYAELVERVPEPAYLIAYGELLDALGRHEEAERQYALFAAEARLFEGNGVTLDVEPVLFYADHGQPAEALAAAEAAIARRPFLDMADAYAWALHVNGRHAEALAWSERARALGTRTALFHFHAGMIQRALGDAEGARRELRQALAINPHFSSRWAPVAQQLSGGGA